jgi:hypothetical protein
MRSNRSKEEHPMAATPDDLNDSQARRAVMLFYDRLPASAWADADKPGLDLVRTEVLSAQEEAASTDQKKLSALLNDDNPDGLVARAVLARMVLSQALASPELAPVAREAIEGAVKPNMAFLVDDGVIIIGLLLATTTIDRDADGSLHVHLGGGAAKVIEALDLKDLLPKLPAVISALPQSLIAKLF